MTVLDDSARNLKREVAELQRRLAERDSENAELQRRLAERESELAESVAQQAASSEVLQVINSSPGNLARVFDAILDRALQLCGGAYGSLLTFDGENFLTGATRGDARFTDWARQRGPFKAPSGGPLHRSLKGEDIVEITDLLEHQQPDKAHLSIGWWNLVDFVAC